MHDDRFGYIYNIVVPIGVQSLGILVGDLKLFGSTYVEVDSVVLDGYAMSTGLQGDVLLSVEDYSGKMIDLRGMQVVQSSLYNKQTQTFKVEIVSFLSLFSFWYK